jgi:tetratricopeptide (TPR) repeat protein
MGGRSTTVTRSKILLVGAANCLDTRHAVMATSKIVRSLAKTVAATAFGGPLAGAGAGVNEAIDLVADRLGRRDKDAYEATLRRLEGSLEAFARAERLPPELVDQALDAARDLIARRGPTVTEMVDLDLNPERVSGAVLAHGERELRLLDEGARELYPRIVHTVYAAVLSEDAALPGLEAAFRSAVLTTLRDLPAEVAQAVRLAVERIVANQSTPAAIGPPPRQTPPQPMHFVDREQELEQLREALLAAEQGTVVLFGMAGAGKTALAQRVAVDPDIEEQFIDGTLWVDLTAVDPMTALAEFASSYGADVTNSTNLQTRAAAVRSLMADRRSLIVLDNAWQPEQVEPLLPSASLVKALVTTRDEDLARLLDDNALQTSTLPEEASLALLEAILGRSITADENTGAQGMLRLLGGLPLAIELAAKRIRKELAHPWSRLADLVHEFEDESRQLDLLKVKNREVRASFNLSYERALEHLGRSRFQALGALEPGELELPAMAALWELDQAAASDGAAELRDLSLLQQTDRASYRLHPLLHTYAREKFAELDETTRHSCHQRVSDYFYEVALNQDGKPTTYEDILPVIRSIQHAVAGRDKDRAARVYPWFQPDSSRTVGGVSIPIPGFLTQHGYSHLLLSLNEGRLILAQTDAERADAEHQVGESKRDLGMTEDAIAHFERALSLYEAENFDLMVAKLSFLLGQAYALVGDVEHARTRFEASIAVDKELDNYERASLSLKQIGDLRAQVGDMAGALAQYEEALDLAERDGSTRSAVIALLALSRVTDPASALDYLDRAAAMQPTATSIPFQGWDGAKLLNQIGEQYAELAPHSEAALPGAAKSYWRAIQLAENNNSPYYRSFALYNLGLLFERVSQISGNDTVFSGAIACYHLSDQLMRQMETPPPINPGERLQDCLRLRVTSTPFHNITEQAQHDAMGMIERSVRYLVEID